MEFCSHRPAKVAVGGVHAWVPHRNTREILEKLIVTKAGGEGIHGVQFQA